MKRFLLFGVAFLSIICKPSPPLIHSVDFSQHGYQGTIRYYILPGKEDALFRITNRHEENVLIPELNRLLSGKQKPVQEQALEKFLKSHLQKKLKNYFLVIQEIDVRGGP